MPPSLSLQSTAVPRNFLISPERPATAGHPFAGLRSRTARISATLLTRDSAARLEEVIGALAWCDEVVVLDTGSTDGTIEIARRHANVAVHRLDGPFPGFGRAHGRAVALARNDWILSIDSDEIVSAELAEEISGMRLDPNTVYSVPFHNFFGGRLITSCGWYPDRHERLFNRTATNFCASEIHERVQTDGLRRVRLRNPVRHYSYCSLDDFLRKMHFYSRLFAEQNAGSRRSSPAKAVTRSVWAFLKSYCLQRGCLQGREGLIISAYKAQTVFWKYLLLDEANIALCR
ncbi:MAG: glycosyltransferase family 2 protein [Opitutaceae bacterium]|jgi:glycosyltransferase involved in cell wall biosynthesis